MSNDIIKAVKRKMGEPEGTHLCLGVPSHAYLLYHHYQVLTFWVFVGNRGKRW
jgi:hypothetical protein